MAIEATPKGSGRNPQATCACDLCGARDVQPVNYERRGNGWQMKEGQVLNRLLARGWSYIKGVLRCPDCETKRKGEKNAVTQPQAQTIVQPAAPSPSEAPPRQPSREQKRQIVTLLTDVYDVDAGRYRGGETDKTVAEAIGGGVLWGWVAQIREEMFGPDGGNDDLALMGEVVKTLRADVEQALRDFDEWSLQVKADREKWGRRLENLEQIAARAQGQIIALKAAVGPRADRV